MRVSGFLGHFFTIVAAICFAIGFIGALGSGGLNVAAWELGGLFFFALGHLVGIWAP